ncbi:putative nucleocapsid protein [rudbeckia virus 1]|uniref:Nucleoprotein n=1 Tax=rudbeckia virus 1 TaxID=2971904 RepID=A0AAX3C959_9RHAB|nr:putative nucleocapsid protein [rudbeckia virus 1]
MVIINVDGTDPNEESSNELEVARERRRKGELRIPIDPKFTSFKRKRKLSQVPQKPWNNDLISKAESYYIPEDWDCYDLDQLLIELLNSITKDDLNGHEAQLIVAGAAYMFKPGKASEERMLKNINFGTLQLDWSPKLSMNGARAASIEKTVRSERSSIEIQMLRDKDQEDLDMLHIEYMRVRDSMTEEGLSVFPEAKRTELKFAYESLLANMKHLQARMEDPDFHKFSTRKESVTEVGIYDEDQLPSGERRYGLYVCGYLLRILSKSAENIKKSWKHKHERFKNFYSHKMRYIDWDIPSDAWIEEIKSQFSLDRTLLQTSLRLINLYEMTFRDDSKIEAGLIRFLFSTPLSYTGMHAYKLFCMVIDKIDREPEWVLSALMCPKFNPALMTILQINNDFEEDVDDPNFNPAFRYARILGPQYFPTIQTKSCPELVLCLSQIVLRMEENKGNYDPMNIAAIKELSNNVVVRMNMIADEFVKEQAIVNQKDHSDIIMKVLENPIPLTKTIGWSPDDEDIFFSSGFDQPFSKPQGQDDQDLSKWFNPTGSTSS